jgi:2-octaprenyl-6-methoxyphenol hydroxylase
MSSRDYDFVIAGGGPAGLTTALALRRTLGQRPRIAVFDPHLGDVRPTSRTYAISAGPMNMLSRIGAWRHVIRPQPVARMKITDSALDDLVRQSYLNFDPPRNSQPLVWIVEHEDLMAALETELQKADIVTARHSVRGLETRPNLVEVWLDDGSRTSAGLLIASDGSKSRVRELLNIPVTGWSYEKSAIVATIQADESHDGLAVQHFLPAGTFALLPLTENRFSVVWVESPDVASAVSRLPEELLLDEIIRRMGNDFGAIALVSKPEVFPLRLQIAQKFTATRAVLIADAAHTMHPLAGQGLNLGLSDVAHLMELLKQHDLLGLDPGSGQMLGDYERCRHMEAVRMLATTDALFHLFISNSRTIRFLRDVGLGFVDSSAQLKNLLIGTVAAQGNRSAPLMAPMENN